MALPKERSKLVILIAIVAVSFGGVWAVVTQESKRRESQLSAKIDSLNESLTELEITQGDLQFQKEWFEEELLEATGNLKAARHLSDRLFSWLIEKGADDIPSLAGRKERIQALEEYLIAFIKTHDGKPEWSKEVAKAKLQLAELIILKGERERGALLLSQAWEAIGDDSAVVAERFLSAQLRLALMAKNQGESKMAAKQLSEILETDFKSSRRTTQIKARAAITLAHISVEKNQYQEARQFYKMAMSQIDELGEMMPTRRIWKIRKSELLREESDVASILGLENESQLLRAAATQGIADLVVRDPQFSLARIQMAKLHRMTAEDSLLKGDSQQALREILNAEIELGAVATAEKNSPTYLLEFVASENVRAKQLRDKGQADEAEAKILTALAKLESIPEGGIQSEADYRKGMLIALQAQIAAEKGDHEKSLSLSQMSYDSLTQAFEKSSWSPVRKQSVLREIAIVSGDLAHLFEQGEDKAAAGIWYAKAHHCWSRLTKQAPLNEEYKEAVSWSLTQKVRLGK